MEEKENQLDIKLKDVHVQNQLRKDAAVSHLSSKLNGAHRDDGLFSGLNASPLEQYEDTNLNTSSVGKGSELSGKSSNFNNQGNLSPFYKENDRFIPNKKSTGDNGSKLNKKSTGNNGSKSDKKSTGTNGSNVANKSSNNSGNNLKQKIQMAAMKKALSANPALAAASNSKTGQAILNAVAKKNNLVGKNTIFDKFLSGGNKKTDGDGKTEEEKSKENSLEKVTMVIMTPKAKILIPVCIACCVVVFGICIFMVAAQVQSSIYGIDASSSITEDSKDVQDNLTNNESKMNEEHVDNEITN